MHLLLIFMYYLRPGDPGIKRFNEFCPLWVKEFGLKITVITGQIHYNTGEIYEDLRGTPLTKENDGQVNIYRVRGPDTYKNGYKGRAWSQIGWTRNVRSVFKQIDKPDIVLGVAPPLWAAWPAVTAKRRWRIPMILEVRDLWPEAIVRMGVASRHHPAVHAVGLLERWAYRQADHLVTIFDGHRNNISDRKLKDSKNITVIPHGVLLDPYDQLQPGTREVVREKLGVKSGQKLVIYAGAHGPMYNLMTLVDVAEKLQNREDIVLVSIGEGFEREKLTMETSRRGLHNLRFLGPVPADEVPAYLSASDIASSFVNSKVLTGWNKDTHGSFRNALFDYAAARLPVVFNEAGYTVRELQERARGGLYANTENGVEEMVHHITRLADDPELRHEMGENNYREIGVRYNRRNTAQTYIELMQRLVERSK